MTPTNRVLKGISTYWHRYRAAKRRGRRNSEWIAVTGAEDRSLPIVCPRCESSRTRLTWTGTEPAAACKACGNRWRGWKDVLPSVEAGGRSTFRMRPRVGWAKGEPRGGFVPGYGDRKPQGRVSAGEHRISAAMARRAVGAVLRARTKKPGTRGQKPPHRR